MDVFSLVAKLTLDSGEYDKGLDNAKESAGGLSSTLKKGLSVAGAAIGAATTAVTAFAGESVKVGAGFDQSMSQVAATMGVAVESIENLREFAQEMGSTTAFSASQAADALNFMALAGYDAETSMQMLPNVLNLAAAGGIELAAASDMVTDAQSALGISLDETAELVDKMAKASSKSNTSVAQLGDAILTVGGTAKDLAGGTTELSTALGILADNGVKGAEGGTALRNIILAMLPTTDKAAWGFERLGLDAYDADGNLRPLSETFADMAAGLSSLSQKDRSDVLNAIFNKVDLKSVNALLSAAGDEISLISEALDESAISWDKYVSEVQERTGDASISAIDLANDISSFLRSMTENGVEAAEQMETLQAEFGLTAEDAAIAFEVANTALAENTNRWDELAGYIDDASGAAQAMAETQLDNLNGDITLFQSALEGAQIAISEGLMPNLREFVQFGSAGISTLTEAFKEGGLSGAMDALGTVLSDGLAMVMQQLPAFVDAGVQLLSSLGEGIIANLPIMVDAALQIIVSLANGIAENLPELIPTIGDVVLQIVDTLTSPETLINLVSAALDIIVALADGLLQAIPRLLNAVPTIISNLITAIIGAIPQFIIAGYELLTALIADLPNIIATIMTFLPTLLTEIVGGLLDSVPLIIDAGVELLTAIIDDLPTIIENIIEALPMIITAIVETLVANIGRIIEAGIKLIAALAEGFVKAIPQLIMVAPQLLEGIVNGIIGSLTMIFDTGVRIVETVKEGFLQKVEDAKQWGQDLISNFIDGIKQKWNDLKSTVSGVAQTVKNFLGFSEPKEGPLSNFHTYAPDMMALFAKGIRDNERLITDQIDKSFDFGTRTIDFASSGIGRSAMGGGYGGGYGSMGEEQNINVDFTLRLDDGTILQKFAHKLRPYTNNEAALAGSVIQ